MEKLLGWVSNVENQYIVYNFKNKRDQEQSFVHGFQQVKEISLFELLVKNRN